jgi:glutaredoxin 3
MGENQKIVRVYSTAICPYCDMAKHLLRDRGLEYQEFDATDLQSDAAELMKKHSWFTVPMIFIGEDFVGGFDELAALDKSGELTALLTT